MVTERDTFVETIADGNQLNEGYFNGCYEAVKNTTTGHDHDGTDSKAFGWVLIETKDLTAGGVATTTFNTNIGSHRVYKLVGTLTPDHTTQADDFICMRLNGDTGSNYSWKHITAATLASTIGTYLAIAVIGYITSNTQICSCMFDVNINNALNSEKRVGVAANSSGNGGLSTSAIFLGGAWVNTPAAITSIQLYTSGSRNFKGKISLYYNADLD